MSSRGDKLFCDEVHITDSIRCDSIALRFMTAAPTATSHPNSKQGEVVFVAAGSAANSAGIWVNDGTTGFVHVVVTEPSGV